MSGAVALSADKLSAEARRAIGDLLVALAEFKRILGFQYASWCVRGPSIEANIALAGMAQEEMGHAMVLAGLLGEDFKHAVPSKDTVVSWTRWSEQTVGSSPLTMIESWPEMIVTCLALDAAATATLEALKSSAYLRLAQRAGKMLQEERFHLTFGVETARTFAAMPQEARQALAARYQRELEEAVVRLASAESLSRLAALGLLSHEAVEARAEFLQSVTRRLGDAWG